MSDRRNVLDLFEEQKSFFETTVKENIEKYRKGNCVLKIKDTNGRALSNAIVRVDQKSHAFRFGANLFMLDELETEQKNEDYKKAVADVFNMATLPFYWDTLEYDLQDP